MRSSLISLVILSAVLWTSLSVTQTIDDEYSNGLSPLMIVAILDAKSTSNRSSSAFFDYSPAQDCNQHLKAGLPSDVDQILCRLGYAVGYDYSTKMADWVAYHITAESVAPSTERNDNFRADTELPSTYRASLDDYSGSGYDRGHLAPNATMDFSYESMDESFLLSNIAPQLPEFNRYGWRDLEQAVRNCATDVGELYVVTGVVHDNELTIGNGLPVPSAFYKAILKPTEPYGAIAFNIPHQSFGGSDILGYATTVDQLEASTGQDFFAAIGALEYSIELTFPPELKP